METQEDCNWNLLLLNEDVEYHHLSNGELLELLRDEWNRDHNAFFVGRDVDSVGRLGVFFHARLAFLGYEDFERQQFWSTYDAIARRRPDWDEIIRLSPMDTHDWSFRRCEIITKERAWAILEHYLSTLKIIDLLLLDENARPVDDTPQGD